MKKGIIGYGGFAKEVFASFTNEEKKDIIFFIDDFYYKNEKKTLPISQLNYEEYEIIVAIGNPKSREELINRLPKNVKFFTYIHPSVIILGDDVKIGEGSIICAGSILTTNITIGKHSHLNLHTSIGHDCIIDDYFTTAPGVKISGNSIIGKTVYFGTNSSVREKLKICDNVTIGLNSGVVKDINESGVYGGVPIKKIK